MTTRDPKRERWAADLATLSPRLQEIAELLAEGLGDKEIANRLGHTLSPSTIRTYVARVYQRLGASSRRELMSRRAAGD